MKKLKMTKPHLGKKSKREIRSRYSADGSYAKDMPVVQTVGQLRKMLEQLPDSLPLNLQGDPEDLEQSESGYKPVWFNVSDSSEHLQFEENDGVWDE